MSSPTRAEREQRIERDNGHPGDTVHYTSWRSSGPGVYHADPECSRLRRGHAARDCTREKAQQMGKPPCTYCVLGENSRGGTRGDDCPYCGDDDVHLATHLPCDGASKDTVEAIADD